MKIAVGFDHAGFPLKQVVLDAVREAGQNPLTWARTPLIPLLFGGWHDGIRDETWEWDGNDWLQRTAATAPSPRSGATMAFDTDRGVVVLFGGSTSAGYQGDTWHWDGSNWQHVVTPHTRVRIGHGMVHETARHRTLVFGGTVDGLQAFDDTWALADLAAPPSYTPSVAPARAAPARRC